VIVVDTNVIAYLLITGEQTEAARAAMIADPVWAAPLLWRSEFRNVLALYFRRRHLTPPQALKLQATAEEILAGREYSTESTAILTLASTSGRSAYDCEFVALARVLDVPLVTSDRQILDCFPETAVSLTAFVAGE
jgi:predicted nucleic acid-binding protein